MAGAAYISTHPKGIVSIRTVTALEADFSLDTLKQVASFLWLGLLVYHLACTEPEAT